MHALIWPLAQATVDESLSHLSEAERRTLTKLMQRVKSKLLELAEHDPVIDDFGAELPEAINDAAATAAAESGVSEMPKRLLRPVSPHFGSLSRRRPAPYWSGSGGAVTSPPRTHT